MLERARTVGRRGRIGARAVQLCALCALYTPCGARAQPAGGPEHEPQPQPEDILPQSELDDPIGVDATSRSLAGMRENQKAAPSARELAAARARYGPEPPVLNVHEGEVLTAMPSVRESAHAVAVALSVARAQVDVTLQLENRAARPAEARYRLAVPDGSTLEALEVCNAHGCRNGVPDPSQGLDAYDAAVLARGADADAQKPVAHAVRGRDARGAAIIVRAAPVRDGQPLRVRVRYDAPTSMHDGVVRLVLPPRGMDAQVAPSEVTLDAGKLLDPRIGRDPAGEHGVSLEAWSEIPLRARLQSGAPAQGEAWVGRCDAGPRCAHARAWAGPAQARPVDLVIALDVSPSTEGPARGRLLPTLAALLSAAPDGSRVRALAFAGRAQALVSDAMEPGAVALAPFERAVNNAELGSATRFSAVWTLARDWFRKHDRSGRKPLIAIVGDGGLTRGDTDDFARARAAGVEVSVLNAADRHVTDALREAALHTGGVALDLGPEAEAAARGRDPTPLGERLAALFVPAVVPRVELRVGARRSELGPLRAGELLAFDGPVQGRFALALGGRVLGARGRAKSNADALVAVDTRDLQLGTADWPAGASTHAEGRSSAAKATCDRRGPAHRESGLSSDALPLSLAEERACKKDKSARVGAAGEPEVGVGMPADPLLEMLRHRILPVARGCFRRDRAGRPQYQKRAVFAFTLAEREVVDARVEGRIPNSLRACLLQAVDTLDVPRFSGTVVVRYPLVTESVPLPAQIELRAETAGALDALFEADAKTPP